MASTDFALLALQLAAMLACAGVIVQIMRKFGQPAVLGEMFAGIILGPTVFGWLLPSLYSRLFTASPHVTMARESLVKIGMLFFLFIAGLEIDLSDFRRLGRKASAIGIAGTTIPLLSGIGLVYLLPDFWGPLPSHHVLPLALFVGMNFANSANPVLARILMDLGLLKKEIGTITMTATIVDDLVNWTVFAIVLRAIAPGTVKTGLALNIGLVILYFAIILLVGRWIGSRALLWVRHHASWPTGFIAMSSVIILAVSAFSELLGIHAFLGAFLAGAAVGKGSDEMKEAHDAIAHFALSFFAPIYFVSMGLNADFIRHFDPWLVLLVIAAAYLTKTGGVLLGARLAGMPVDRYAWAISFGLNARGATGIILAGVGLKTGLIDQRLFVAMVVMCLATSMLAGPMIKRFIGNTGSEPAH